MTPNEITKDWNELKTKHYGELVELLKDGAPQKFGEGEFRSPGGYDLSDIFDFLCHKEYWNAGPYDYTVVGEVVCVASAHEDDGVRVVLEAYTWGELVRWDVRAKLYRYCEEDGEELEEDEYVPVDWGHMVDAYEETREPGR